MANVQKLNIRPNKELLTSLVALWEFNESSGSTAVSSVGSFNATLGAGGSFASGKMGNCLVTTGATNGYAMITADTAFDTSEFTMNVWANVSGAGSQSDSFIFGTRASYTNNGARYIEYENAGGRQYMPNILVGDSVGNTVSYADTSALTIGTWYMLTMTVASDRKLRYYRNGSLISTSAAIAGTGNFNLRYYLTYGALRDHGNVCEYGMNGKVDSAGVWNRALSDAEVTSLYNSTNGLPYANFTDQAWKDVTASFINIGDVWKPIVRALVNVGDVWKQIFPTPATTTYTYATPGSDSLTYPADVTSVVIECWGGGGSGGRARSPLNYSAGGGGGAYSKTTLFYPTPGQTATIAIGAGGTASAAGTAGGTSSVYHSATPICLAVGGGGVADQTGGATGGASASGTGDVKYSGGNGASGSSSNYSGGGGEGACITANGNNASGQSAGTGCSGGDGGTGFATGANHNGNNGSQTGGGGGGATRLDTNMDGGTGGAGKVVITVYNF